MLTAAYKDAPAYEERDGLKIFRLPAVAMPATRLAISFDMAFTLRPSLPRRVAGLLDDFKPQVLHQHGQFFDLTWVTGAWADRHQVPVLLSVHTRLESPTPKYARLFRLLDAIVVAPLLRRFRPTFVVMDAQMDVYINTRYRRAVRATVAIPVGVAPRPTSWDADVVRRRHGFAADAPIVLSIGHVIQMRDRVALVEALPAVRAQVPNARVLVVGKVYVHGFQKRAQELGVDDMVISTGAVPREHIGDYLAAAGVESHDLQGYGLGTASLESMAAAVPVVVAVRPDNFPGVELLTGQNCWLVDTDDPDGLAEALVTALTKSDLARQVGLAGQRLVERHFTVEAVLEQHLQVLTKLIKDAE